MFKLKGVVEYAMEVPKAETNATPFVTYSILALTFLVQSYMLVIPDMDALVVFESYSLIPVYLFQLRQMDTIVTYMFLHGNFMHMIVNSIALLGAGFMVEREIGHIRFLVTFIASGVIAGVVHCLLNSESGIPLVGSSVAVFGIIALMFLLMPFKLTYTLVVPLPSVIVGLMLTLVEISAVWFSTDSGIAHDVHIIGFLVGGFSAFVIDQKKALRGLFIAVIVLLALYYIATYFNLMPSPVIPQV